MPGEIFRTSIEIEAPPDAVYRYFTEPESLVRWMGSFAAIDPRPGGQFSVDVNGVPIRGHYLELDPPKRVVFSWGHAGSDALPPGASTVEIRLELVNGGTRVELEHRDLPPVQAEIHAMGWPHYVERLVKAGAGLDPGPDQWETNPPDIPEEARRWRQVG